NIGHFGLSYDAYAHFTSPIRRYPDLLTHRAIKAILHGKKYEPKGIDPSLLNTTISNAARKQQVLDKAAGKKKPEQDLTIWDALGVHCSANERRADEASRDVEAWLKCYFIRNKIGEEFTGTISGVTQFGIFVQLDDIYIEGLVHVTELGADYFQYDDARHELRGERTGKRYQLTDRVTVEVSRVDLDARKIDLSIVQPTGIRPPLAMDAGRTGEHGKMAKAAGKAVAKPGKSAVDAVQAKGKSGGNGAAKARSKTAPAKTSARQPAANTPAGKRATKSAASRTGKKKR
ncbi:RNB domain-containing ribonuclease, partial [Undibacterium sp.]|uniref:RNB domain-containing ribonuclease n=1 Tax=Undibacterium sp. TaxID=1914977 RepID=UPI002CAA329A